VRRLLFVTFAASLVLPLLAIADNVVRKEPAKQAPPGKQVESAKAPRGNAIDTRPNPAIAMEQEAAAIALVQEHHKDLFELLIHLKEGLPQEYERAIRDLSRASDRLAQFEKRDPERYRLELQLWQAGSRRQLLAARLQMGYDESLLNELRNVLSEEQKLALAVLRHERERLAGRIAKIDEQITAQEDNADASVERKFTTLTKAAKNSERNAKNKNRKPAARKNTKDPT
jgi:DNA-directed RNA polymerase subunit L